MVDRLDWSTLHLSALSLQGDQLESVLLELLVLLVVQGVDAPGHLLLVVLDDRVVVGQVAVVTDLVGLLLVSLGGPLVSVESAESVEIVGHARTAFLAAHGRLEENGLAGGVHALLARLLLVLLV